MSCDINCSPEGDSEDYSWMLEVCDGTDLPKLDTHLINDDGCQNCDKSSDILEGTAKPSQIMNCSAEPEPGQHEDQDKQKLQLANSDGSQPFEFKYQMKRQCNEQNVTFDDDICKTPKSVSCGSSSKEVEYELQPSVSSTSDIQLSDHNQSSCNNGADLADEMERLNKKYSANNESLRILNLVKCHRSKNNLQTLDKLIAKWRRACQLALEELHGFAPKQPATSMRQMISYLGIDSDLVGFVSALDAFDAGTALPKHDPDT